MAKKTVKRGKKSVKVKKEVIPHATMRWAKCELCGYEFMTDKRGKLYCSPECWTKAYRDRYSGEQWDEIL